MTLRVARSRDTVDWNVRVLPLTCVPQGAVFRPPPVVHRLRFYASVLALIEQNRIAEAEPSPPSRKRLRR